MIVAFYAFLFFVHSVQSLMSFRNKHKIYFLVWLIPHHRLPLWPTCNYDNVSVRHRFISCGPYTRRRRDRSCKKSRGNYLFEVGSMYDLGCGHAVVRARVDFWHDGALVNRLVIFLRWLFPTPGESPTLTRLSSSQSMISWGSDAEISFKKYW